MHILPHSLSAMSESLVYDLYLYLYLYLYDDELLKQCSLYNMSVKTYFVAFLSQ